MNRMYFSSDEVKKGNHLKLIETLLSLDSDRTYCDIHLYQEEDAIVVEWDNVYYSMSNESGRFVYLNPDEVVMKEVLLPDNTYQYIFPEEEKELFSNFLQEHPEYEIGNFGRYTDTKENFWSFVTYKFSVNDYASVQRVEITEESQITDYLNELPNKCYVLVNSERDIDYVRLILGHRYITRERHKDVDPSEIYIFDSKQNLSKIFRIK